MINNKIIQNKRIFVLKYICSVVALIFNILQLYGWSFRYLCIDQLSFIILIKFYLTLPLQFLCVPHDF